MTLIIHVRRDDGKLFLAQTNGQIMWVMDTKIGSAQAQDLLLHGQEDKEKVGERVTRKLTKNLRPGNPRLISSQAIKLVPSTGRQKSHAYYLVWRVYDEHWS